MMLLIKLLLAHFLGDFLFQSEKSVRNKEEKRIRSPHLYIHMVIHAILLIILLGSSTSFWPILGIIIISHYLIDLGKLYFQDQKNKRKAFFVDQFLHLVIIVLTAQFYEPYFDQLKISGSQLLLILLALTLLTIVSALMIRMIISIWSPQTNDSDDESLAK
ncbi:MAG: DUF3307 domain-containing protein, partial [Saprospiraceae bacterium]|nr:DUF3307 domain-containing protein [Saprospiraceae bacterium]